MRIDVVLAKLNKIKLGIKPEYCLGCGCENSCSVRGCAVIRAAIEALRAGGDIRVPTSEERTIRAFYNEDTGFWEAMEEPYCTVEIPTKEDYIRFLDMVSFWQENHKEGGDCDGSDAELQGLHTPDSDLPRS